MTVGEMYPGGLCLYIFRALLRIVIAGSWSDLQRSARERSVFLFYGVSRQVGFRH